MTQKFDAPRIIGRDKFFTRTVVCSVCAAVVEYLPRHVIVSSDEAVVESDFTLPQAYILCPDCETILKVPHVAQPHHA
jgi:hypothetical protein